MASIGNDRNDNIRRLDRYIIRKCLILQKTAVDHLVMYHIVIPCSFWAWNSWYSRSLAAIIFTKWQSVRLWIALDFDEFNSHTPTKRNRIAIRTRKWIEKSKRSKVYYSEAYVDNCKLGRWAVQTIAALLPRLLGHW